MKLKTVFLIVAVIAIPLGIIGVGSAPQWTILFPLGVVSALAFLLFQLLGKETEKYDREHADRLPKRPKANAESARPDARHHELDPALHTPRLV